MKVKIKRISPDAIIPTKATPGSNGYDLFSVEQKSILPGGRIAVSTGISAELPEDYVALVCSRSGMAIKNGVAVINAPGVIDADYRGEWKVLLVNHGESVMEIQNGQKVAQVLFVKTENAEFDIVDELNDSVRGSGGFGSTGK